MQPIAATSLLVAAMRALEHERGSEPRLIDDPFARALAGDDGFALLNAYRTAAGDTPPVIAVRTRYLDDRLLQGVAQGWRQVIVLAAGMDARAFRLNFPEGVRLFELDRDEVLAEKHARLAAARPRCTRIVVPADLREDWPERLAAAGMNAAEPALWLIEGLLVYLDEALVSRLFTEIDRLSAPGSRIWFDVLSRRLLLSRYLAKQIEFMRRANAPWRFGMDDPVAFMAAFGWNAETTELQEVAPSRWPWPRAAGEARALPRSFLVEAHKPR